MTFNLEFPKLKTLISSLKERSMRKTSHINFLKEEVFLLNLQEKLSLPETSKTFKKLFEEELCSDLPSASWEIKKHDITFPYEDGFNEKQISTKARPI